MTRPCPVIVGVDIGGTFTDFVVADERGLRVHKVPSTPDDPSGAFLRGVSELALPPDARYVHGSTVATNALLERRGARAALLTNEGFQDLLELGRQTRSELYALTPTKHVPLIARERCFGVPGRIDRTGKVLEPLDEAALGTALEAAAAAGAESLAVVFLFSFANPEHERAAGRLAKRRGLTVSLSSEILPEYREYERAGTTAANAYVAPVMDRCLARLDERLSAYGRERLQVMQSNGGVISVEAARREAVRTVLSGPAGGVVGAWKVASLAGFDRVLTFDMGGTSTDVALVDGEPTISSEGSISGLPIRVPMLDIHTVGAGGGSLARVEAEGLRVGPESAGADPGPAAYGRGGGATVTDANIVLGRLHLPSFAGGRMVLDPELSRAAVAGPAGRLGLTVEAMAAGIVQVANVQMARALRRVSVERGCDPREFALVAFGGAGPLHACDLAREMGIRTVLLPRFPGALSALGMLLTDIRKEYSRTVMRPLSGPLDDLESLFQEQERRAEEDLLAEGVSRERHVVERWLDVRYRGQSYELSLPLAELCSRAIAGAYDEAHRKRFGCASPGAPCEVVQVRLRAAGLVDGPRLPRADAGGRRTPEPPGYQEIYTEAGRRRCPVYDRTTLLPGDTWRGPALLAQADATAWIPEPWAARVDGWYNVLITHAD